MIRQDVAVGGMIVLVCLAILFNERLFLEKTKKGQRLTAWLGPDRGRWALRGIALLAMIFGILLAYGIIRPLQW